MADPRPLIKTSLADVQPLSLDGQPVHARHAALAGSLRAHASPAAAALFAEPLAGAAAITWYTEGAGEPTNLSDLPQSRADTARQRLTRALAELEPLLEDPAIGTALRHALVVPGRRSIWVMDGGVVLSDWGSVAAGNAVTPSALAAQVRDVFGAFSPLLGRVDERFFAGAPLSVFRAAAPAPASAPAAAPRSAAPAAAALAATGAATGAAAPPAHPAAAAARPLWVLPFATLVALLFLLLGFWLAWIGFARDLASQRLVVPLIDEGATSRAIEAQRATNQALERELERARRAADTPNVCTSTAPLELNPAPERQPVPPAAVPPAVPPPPGGATALPPVTNLAQLLERSTVLIVSLGANGNVGHGTGFFVSGDTIVTNAHVVEAGPGARYFVTSALIARAIPVTVAAMTTGPNGSPVQPGMLDLAVIRLPEAVPNAQPLAFTPQSERLTDVVAAGYPMSVVQDEMRAFAEELVRGRVSRPPELVVTRGIISSVQQLPGVVVLPHSADISAGNSGGPLVDNCGRVVGINTFVTRSSAFADRVKYAQRADSALPWLQQNAIRFETRPEACAPVVPGLPALPQAAAPPDAAPPAAATPAGTPATPAPPAR